MSSPKRMYLRYPSTALGYRFLAACLLFAIRASSFSLPSRIPPYRYSIPTTHPQHHPQSGRNYHWQLHSSLPPPNGSTLPPNGSITNFRRQRNNNNNGTPYSAGQPSSPGWKQGQLETLVSWAVSDKANRPVMREYEPDALWLWSQWRGTVLSLAFVPVVLNMLVGIGVDRFVHSVSESSWPLLAIPPSEDPVIQQLAGLNAVWDYQVTLTTFILTFFTAEAYKHWRSVYFTTRAIQGRINDICMLVTMGVNKEYANSEASQELVARVTRLIRKSHSFFWAATPTVSDGLADGKDKHHAPQNVEEHEFGPMLLTPEGLRGLANVGELTHEEADALLESGLPPTQYTYVLMEWVGLYIMEGLDLELLGHGSSGKPNNGLEENILRQLTMLRGEYFNLGDLYSGRMPLAYVHLVQVLVDSLLVLAPFSLYSGMGSLSIPLTGLLTLFYKGLLELSKSFLDPFGVEGYPGQNIRVDVLVSELNFGAASRWVVAAKSCPPSNISVPQNDKRRRAVNGQNMAGHE
ncbi:expressed unknown protein [Seminavis robusta]|uniref:Uncharacterized protein n=1 Tax=Seminavis robusta TaxID=568900 RepID=A0A9N8E8B8_9STRA|nr:expressed unknown protein [Seminavis robusta]|eukprot:Sro731_g194310.1 n/a (520) ;mRNA; r:36464-38158